MGFTTNYQEKELLPEGIYEVVCTQCLETATKGGTIYINMRLLIRDDLAQDSAGEVHYESLFKRKNPDKNDMAVGGYSFKRIMQISESFGLPAGASFDSLDDWCKALLGKCAQITVEHSTYNDKTSARVKWFNRSKAAPYRPKEEEIADVEADPNDFEEVDFDDLPFN